MSGIIIRIIRLPSMLLMIIVIIIENIIIIMLINDNSNLIIGVGSRYNISL